MQVSVVITVLNEAQSLPLLCRALSQQTKPPHEVIIVDGGSSDNSLSVLTHCQRLYPQLSLTVQKCAGNRSLGRNMGIKTAKTPWIAITDAGCEPTPTWLAELCATHTQTGAPVIAGYYQGRADSPLAEAIIPYVLVMPDQIDPAHFLPATRSMLMKKAVWQELGGFNQNLSHNEDYALARAIQTHHYPIAFTRRAIVVWHPRTTITSFAHMVYRFALGDAESRCYRPKVWLIFGRYGLALFSYISLVNTIGFTTASWLAGILLLLYSGWAISKNYRYAHRGWYWLPVLQLVADVMVMTGTVIGLLKQKPQA